MAAVATEFAEKGKPKRAKVAVVVMRRNAKAEAVAEAAKLRAAGVTVR